MRTLERNTSAVYVILKYHPEAEALVNAFQIIHALTGKKLDIPSEMIECYSELAPIASSQPGPDFFFAQ